MLKLFVKLALYLTVTIGVSTSRADTYLEFFKAVELNDSRTVSTLLLRGFDPNAVDRNGQVALVSALVADAPRVFEMLLAHPEVRVDAANAFGETPLMMAALRGNLDAMKQLIDRNAAINRPGWSPLHYAASGPELRAVDLLIERGAELDARAPNGNTPLMMAARYGAQDAAVRLLLRGADPTLRNQAGATAADLARTADRDRLADRLADAARRRQGGQAP